MTISPPTARETRSSPDRGTPGRRVLSQIDIKPREWPVNTILAACFTRGELGSFEPVFGGPTWRDGKSTFFRNPPGRADLALSSGYRVPSTPYKLVAKFRSGSRFAVWHGEQIYGPWAYETKLNLSRLEEYDRHVDAHLVWGSALGSLLRSECGIPAERIYVVGCPKFDLLRPPLWERIPEERQRVLFVSDFRICDLQGEQYARAASLHGWGDDVPALRARYEQARDGFVACIASVAQAAPAERVVVRSHPQESLAAYEPLAELPNVTLDPAQRPFGEALAEAKVILQFRSTSYFESRIAGIPTYCLDLVDWRGDDPQQQYYAWITPAQLFDELGAVLSGTLNVPSERPFGDAASSLFSHDRGPSIPRTLAAIQMLCDMPSRTRWARRDLARMAAYTLRHKAKETGARAALAASGLGLHTRFADRTIAAQRRYEDGPDYIGPGDAEVAAREWIDGHGDYIDSVLAMSEQRRVEVTDGGTLVTCPGPRGALRPS